MKKTICAVLCMALLWCVCSACAEQEPGSWLSSILGDAAQGIQERAQASAADSQSGSIARLLIDGEISAYAYDYDHQGTLQALEELCADEDNSALLLVLNTPGGSLYEADELYHAVMMYKQETGRPVYAYMQQECCSAGVYIAMAADRIAASRMTITGSIGVYMQAMSEAGLYDMLGIDNEYVATGRNKVTGYPELTDEQIAIYQSLVEESFGFFKQAITSARGLTEEQMQGFLDGRLLSALQAKDLGLIDTIAYEGEFEDSLIEAHGGIPLEDVTPAGMFDDLGFGSDVILNWFDYLMPGVGAEAVRERPSVRGLQS